LSGTLGGVADVDEVDDEYGAFRHPRAGDIAELAYAQHGVVAMWQLRERGFGTRWVQRRVEGKALHRRYRGVYAVGHQKLTLRGKWMAAVLASGPNALLSHRAAVALWELRPAPSGAIDVTVCARGRRGHKGIRIHNTRTLADDDRATLDGIPVTSAYRALLDYAEVARYQQLRLALEAAVRRDLLDAGKLDELIERSHGRHGLKR